MSITIHATQLIFSNRTVSIDTAPLAATIHPVSALNLMLRSAAGMLGAAVSTAAGFPASAIPLVRTRLKVLWPEAAQAGTPLKYFASELTNPLT